MSNLIDDFVESSFTKEGYGFFEGNTRAVDLARGMSKSEIRKYRRYGLVPRAFFEYLEEIKVVPDSSELTLKELTVDDLLDLLWSLLRNCQYSDEKHCLAADFFRKSILIAKLPMLQKSFGSADGIWQKIETG